ncbi:MAG TPA: GntR family transcriptional regulator [Chloroflexota bacterium]|nr:GntR family transcriptional regulator [Chloroflexota bacterium]
MESAGRAVCINGGTTVTPGEVSLGNDPATPPVNTATLAQQVYEHLRRDILNNAYQPNAPLPEETIAGRLNVSRAPVREALRRLAAEGLVTLIPRQGAAVTALSPRDFLNAYQVREVLEALAIRLAVPHLQPSDLGELDRLHERMAGHVARGAVDDFFADNAAFHLIFVDRSGNDKLQEIYAGLISQMRRYYVPSLYLRGGMERSLEEHGAILRAVKEGNADEAAHLMAEHIRLPRRILEADPRVELVPLMAQRATPDGHATAELDGSAHDHNRP